MRKMILLTYLIVIAALFKCSSASSGDTTTGFKEIDFSTTYTWAETKTYTLTGPGTVSGDAAIAIYYSGTLNNTNYSGIAIRAYDNSYNMKIYSSDGGVNYSVVYRNTALASPSTCSEVSTTIFTTAPSTANGFGNATFNTYNICSTGHTIDGTFKGVAYP